MPKDKQNSSITVTESSKNSIDQANTGTYRFFKAQLPNPFELQEVIQHKIVKEILAGDYHSIFLTYDDTVLTCGRNSYGQLGVGHWDDCTKPTLVPLAGVKRVIAGRNQTFFVTLDDNVYACGLNDFGQLGLGHNKSCNRPTLVPGLTDIKDVIVGDGHTIFLTKGGQVYTCGKNHVGQLGLGHNKKCNKPTLVPLPAKVKQVFARFYQTFLLTEDDQVYACGWNLFGQLNVGQEENCNNPTPVQLAGVKEIAVGREHTVFLMNNGSVFSGGLNHHGQLGLGRLTEADWRDWIRGTPRRIPALQPRMSGYLGNVKKVITGNNHTVLITMDNKVLICGENFYGQLGLGKEKDDFDGKYKYKNHNQPTLATTINLNGVIAGPDSTILQTSKGNVIVCGLNDFGQLGLGNYKNSDSMETFSLVKNVQQVAVGLKHTIFLTREGSILTCGLNDDGQLGLGNTDSCNKPRPVPIFEQWVKIQQKLIHDNHESKKRSCVIV